MRKEFLIAAGIAMSFCLAFGADSMAGIARAKVAPNGGGNGAILQEEQEEFAGDDSTVFFQEAPERKGEGYDNSQVQVVVFPEGDPNFKSLLGTGKFEEHLLEERTDDSDEVFFQKAPEKKGESYDNSQVQVVVFPEGDPNFKSLLGTGEFEKHLLEEPKVRGTYEPTAFWNLSSKPYEFTLSNMTNYAYTNYYFAVGANDNIAADFSGLTVTGDTLKVTLYVSGTSEAVSSWTGKRSETAGVGWTGLNPDKFYYFKFESVDHSIVNGTGYITNQ